MPWGALTGTTPSSAGRCELRSARSSRGSDAPPGGDRGRCKGKVSHQPWLVGGLEHLYLYLYLYLSLSIYLSVYLYIYIYACFVYPYVENFIIPTDELICFIIFQRVDQPDGVFHVFSHWTYGLNMGLTWFHHFLHGDANVGLEIWIRWWLICYSYRIIGVGQLVCGGIC